MALAKYLDVTNIRTLNIVTSGMHARRTWWVYSSVLGRNYKIGIISVRNNSYNSYNLNEWWESSEGVRDLISESIKYTHSRMSFKFD